MPRATSFKFIDESARECKECNLVFDYPQLMRKHMRTHEHVKSQGNFRCSWPGCSFTSPRRSNFNTHYRTHTQEKSKACPDCDFRACDPASIFRHRKRIHKYIPNARKGRAASNRSVSPASASTSFESVLDFSSFPSASSNASNSESAAPSDFSSSPSTLSSASNSESAPSDLSSLSSSAWETNSSTIDPDYATYSQIPLDSDGLFNQPDALHCFEGTGLNWDEKLLGVPCPRPLFPAVDSTPSLEDINPTFYSKSESWSDLSLFFGNPSEPLAYSEITTSFQSAQDTNLWQNMNVSTGQNFGQAHHLQSTTYDACTGGIAEINPSTPVVISPEHFQVIFGSESDNHVERASARLPEVSSRSDISTFNSAYGLTNLTRTLSFESVPSTTLSSSSMDSLFGLDQTNTAIAY
ncbi:hypothetical protein GGU10DRAFT_417652 [Lentinula aff. detonsa]|uniref:C2H2-type domain-containing protein n=1 Tax=Lentinula aff. detonsa TaxID=2804958 RepID=A0AA38NMI6_9AGAR|nr:hypothetical protein GGU10DRAFT_417652 [Lentinula aff. detonsa]